MTGFIYVLEWSTGVIKVGKSKAPDSRIRGHVWAAEVFGVELIRQSVIRCADHEFAERELIEWIAQRSTKRIRKEWHFGVSYAETVEKAQSLADIKRPSPQATERQPQKRCSSLREYLKQPGAAARLSKDLGVCKQAVSQWKDRGVPIARMDDVERATGGTVTAFDLMHELRKLRAAA